MFKLASLFVDVTAKDDQFQGRLGAVKGQLGAMGTAAAVAVGNLSSAAILGATRAVAGFFEAGVKGAVDLAETSSKVQAIFGESSSIIQSEAEAMASKFGVVKSEFLDAASSFGSAFKAAGSSQADAAALGNQLAKLGMDMASFGNGTNAEVFTALQAALRGEFDPLERFNVMLTAAKVSEEAMSLGLIKNAKDLDEASKKQATLSLIMKGTADQQGDLERTADGTANSWRKLTGTMTNLATAIGTTLEPALNAIVGLANEMALSIVSGAERADGAFQAFADGVKEGVDYVGFAWRNFADVWEMTTIRIGGHLANAWATVRAFGANVVELAGWIGRNWFNLITDAMEAAGLVITGLAENLGNLALAVLGFFSDPTGGFDFQWKPLLDGFRSMTEELPEIIAPALVDVQDRIDAVADRVGEREVKRAGEIEARKKAAAAAAGPKPQAAAAAAKKDEFKSELIATGDFSSRLASKILGADDTAKKQLETQKEIAAATKETAEAVKRPQLARLG